MTPRVPFLLLVLCLSALWARATHIVGGTLGYTYLGPGTGNTSVYRITLITYTDCSPTSEIPVPESLVHLGIYLHDPANPAADKVLKQAITAPLLSSHIITPPLPPGCSVGLGTCIYKGIYETEVVLDNTSSGYHVYYERCCRNTALVNIQNPSQMSTAFYVFIPPTDIPNSSPVFVDDPVPLICVNDSLHLLNTAIDPDGDELIYSFTVPYAGFADILNPAPLPQPTLPWPITPVTYQGGFSSGMPFGPGSYTSLHALTGASVFKTALTGNFVVAVQVSEYRNGNLISVTRRDMQLISLVCPQNQPPVGDFSATGLSPEIVEGDTLCFDFSYLDPEGDSVTLDVSGEPFLLTPPAVFTPDSPHPGMATGSICWSPPCGSARLQPYTIMYQAVDNGCIPQQQINLMQVTVIPDTAKLFITGDTLVCGLEQVTYQTNKDFGVFHWTVTGGTLTQPSNGSSATVAWNLAQGQTGEITVIRDGLCTDDTAHIQVNIAPPEFADQVADLWLCPGSSGPLMAEPGGSNYLWTPGTWLNDSTIYNPITSTPDSLYYHVTYRDSSGCEKFDSALVAVNNQVPLQPGPPVAVCDGLPVSLGGSPTGPAGATYQWEPAASFTDPTSGNPTLPDPQTGWYSVTVSVDTCHATDSVLVTVHPLPDVDAGNDTSVCTQAPLLLNGTGAGTLQWNGQGLTLSNPQIGNPQATAVPGVYLPVLTATSPQGCTATDTVRIEIWALPQVSLSGDFSLCLGDTLPVTATGAIQYAWQFGGYLSSPFGSTVQISADTAALLTVTGTDTNGCTDDTSAWVDVFRGTLSLSSPDTVLCAGESITLSYGGNSESATFWVPATYLNSGTGSTVVSIPEQDITYTAYTTDSEGCTDSAQVTLLVKPLPVLDAEYETTLFCQYVEVILHSNNTTDSLHWLHGNTAAGSGPDATIHLDPQDPETVYLTGTTAFGCRDTLAISPDFATLNELLPQELPNIITPNGDGLNDLWNPPLPAGFADCSRLTLYNRWGAEVFDSRQFPLVWNGKTASGNALTDGVYFYILEIGGVYKKGTVTVSGSR